MISWTTYLSWLCLALVIYYVVVVLFFRTKAGELLKRKKKVVEKKAVDNVLFRGGGNAEGQNAASMAPIHSLVDELQALVSQAAKEQLQKEVLTDRLRRLLSKYPGTKGSIYQNGLANLIELIVEDKCSMKFSADELSALWE
ncbi:hypothetical protein KTO58_05580 [Chitinophaga pendula]|uniref:hypothetical protein n=1 Tax=Chitinophaga TaxID=79328 RepID=UPI000BAFEA7B|nr:MULTISPECIES: hypothetical protein [Chitinophaga]ASZ13724.1 hypothetical protein CK934_23595 [Chitinophaga sp. MD30]UCJ08658.1 hypothetical protein KTO58_05580 [Chitinophaga pendula]